VDMRPLPGRPDGAALDSEGGYWICANDAGLVHRFTPDGRLERSLPVPVSKPSMCSFGGPALDCLFITSIRPAQPQGDDIALGGAVFITRPGFTGLAETPFQPGPPPA
jgi:sugar lactone lactonase YvrE